MKILHCSDLHIDSPLTTNLPADKAKERKGELAASFGRLVDYAKKESVSAVIIAGDLFDGDTVSFSAREIFISALKSAQEMRFFICTGNHDGESFLRSLNLPNVTVFGKEWKYFDLGGVTITGLSFCAYDNLLSELSLDKNSLNIVALHGVAALSGGGENINLNLLKNKNVNYLALGHYHDYNLYPLDKSGVYCYSGCLEGRGYDEKGEKGFVLLDIAEKITPKFIPFSRRVIHSVETDISGCVSSADISGRVENAVIGIKSGDMAEVVLKGNVGRGVIKGLNYVAEQFKNRFYHFKLKDKSKLAIDKTALANEVSLAGEFTRLVLNADINQELADKIIYKGIMALRGEKDEV